MSGSVSTLADNLEDQALMSIEQLIDDFSYLDDWEERYRHVIELGKSLAPLAPEERSAQTKVEGCVSQVWLVTDVGDGPNPVLTFRGESDAHIVKGLIAVLLDLYSGKTAKDILAIDAQDVFRRLGLNDALSPQRSNGLFAMVERIRFDAKSALTDGGNGATLH